MRVKLSDNGLFIQIIDADRIEIDQIKITFTKKLDNWFIMKKKNPNWNCEISFFDRYLQIPFGLWKEFIQMCVQFGFSVDFAEKIHFFDPNFKDEDFLQWVDEYFGHDDSEMKPRDYQSEGAMKAIKYRYCTEEISTSGGKTFISYMIFQYLLDKKKIKRLLYIVPNVGLITQGEGDFYEYVEKSGHKPNWKTQCIYSGERGNDVLSGDVVFGTYQSLSKKPIEFFESVDAIICDECLHPDTLITMSDGSNKKISEINIGDKVYTINEDTSEISIKEVEYVYKNLSKGNQMYELEMEDGSILKITGNHKVLIEGNIWKRVDELTGEENIIDLFI